MNRRFALLTVVLATGPFSAFAAPPPPDCGKDLKAQISPAEQRNVQETTVVNGRRTATVVTLNGNSSKGTTYAWTQLSGDPTVVLAGASTDTATFVAPDVGPNGTTFTFRLTVGLAGCANKTADTTVTITDSNHAPVAVASVAPAEIFAGDAFTLSSAGSYDPDGDTLSYLWEQFDGTDWVAVSRDATAELLAPATVPSPDGLSLTYRLTVSDGYLDAPTTQLVNVQANNKPPVAIVTCTPSAVEEGGTVTLDGSASQDDAGIVSYSWTQIVGGPAAVLPVDQLSAPSLSFIAPSLVQSAGGDEMTFGLTVTDAGGLPNEARCEVQVLDVTAPELTLPATPITAEATGSDGAVVTWSASAHDAWSGDVALSCDADPGATFPLGKTTVSCHAEDAAGNSAQGSFEIDVVDTTAPVMPALADRTIEATSAAGAVVTWSPGDADDVVDGKVPLVCAPASGTVFALGTTSVDCTATDDAGNAAHASFTVQVVDTTPPAFATLGDVTEEATSSAGAAVTWPAVSATDLVDGAIAATCTPASGALFPLDQATTVTCTAADRSGNSATATFLVEVLDRTAPAFAKPDDLVVEATSSAGATVTWAPIFATDAVDGSVLVDCVPASGSTFALGTTPVTCTATDAHGNSSSHAFDVTVRDTTPPALKLPADITAAPTQWNGAFVTYTATAEDLVDGAVATTCTPASGSLFLGTTTVTCTASDAAGNSATGTFVVHVNYTLLGFFQPVDNLLTNTVKGGATVPVKFKLQGKDGVELTDTAAFSGAKAVPVPCGTVPAAEDAIELTYTGGTSLRYDATALQFIFNWQTPKSPGTCVRLEVTFADGQKKTASFKLK